MFALSDVPRETVELDSFRLQASPDALVNAISRRPLDSRSIVETLEFMKVNETDPLDIFDRKKRFFDSARRYGHSVLYTALERKTGEDEIKYWVRRDYHAAGDKITVWKTLFSVEFRGNAKNICSKLSVCSSLIDDNYAFCNTLAEQANAEDLDALIAPSARNAGGQNLPVFKKSAVVKMKAIDCIPFAYDPMTGHVEVGY